MFRTLVLNYDERRDLETTPEATQLRIDKYHYAVVSLDEVNMLLRANSTKRSQDKRPAE